MCFFCYSNCGDEDPLKQKLLELRKAAARYTRGADGGAEIQDTEEGTETLPTFDIDFSTKALCITFIDSMTADVGESLDGIPCRGLSFASVRTFQASINDLFSSF